MVIGPWHLWGINKASTAIHIFSSSALKYNLLNFQYIVIATAFIRPLRDPVRNIWVIQFGMIACIMVFPVAFIAGTIRQIPFFWQLIDCSFGMIGLIPLFICYRKIQKLEYLELNNLT
jgi:hypothetical protein